MMPKQQVTHRVQITLSVSSVAIEIRFPCKLQVSIKVGKEETHMVQEVQLQSGTATFTENLEAQAYLAYDVTLRKYLEKKSNITVYVVSPRGKNVAGVYPLDLSLVMNSSSQQQILANQKLERCPDREATISFKVKGFLVEELVDANISMFSDRSGQFPQSANKLNSISSDRQKIQTRYRTQRLQSNLSQKKLEREPSHNHKRSFVDESRSPFRNRLMENKSDSGRSYREQVGIQSFRSKNKIDELSREVEVLRREAVEKKKLQSEVEDLGYKVIEMQKVINGNKVEMDSTNKRKRTDIVEYSNKIQELEKINMTLQKRLDIKGAFYKEELEKYNTKLIAVENEKQQLVAEVSSLKDQTFDLNRKIGSLKDKEKMLNDDKLKLMKRIEEAKRQPVQRAEGSVTGSARDVMYERLRQTISNNQLERLSLTDELQKLKNQMLNEGIFRTKYQQQLKQKNSVIQQKIVLESQYTLVVEESKSETLRLNKQLIERTDEIHILNTRMIELTSKNKTEVARLVGSIEEMKDTLEFVRQTEEKGRVEYQDLTYLFNQNQRDLEATYNKLLGMETALKDARFQNQGLMKNLNKSVEEGKRLGAEIERLRQFIQNVQREYSTQGQAKRNIEFTTKTQIQKLQSSNKQLQKELSFTIQQLSTLKLQFQEQDNVFGEQMERKDRIIKEKEQEIRNIYEQETHLQMRNAELESKLGELRESSKVGEGELVKERGVIESLRKANAVLTESEGELKVELEEVRGRLEEKEVECEGLGRANESLENHLLQTRVELEEYQQNTNKHINSLLKSLVTRAKTEELFILPGLSEGLIKLQSEVISKVKGCYQQLESVSQKLLNKEMESIGLEQNGNLQIQTLQIQVSQLKKQYQITKEQNLRLTSTIEDSRGSHISESQSLKNRIKDMEVELPATLAQKLKEQSTLHQQTLTQLKSQHFRALQQSQGKIHELQQQASTSQKQLYDQYNEVNVMTLKNYELNQIVKQLEERLANTSSNQGMWLDERGRLVNDIMYLEDELRRLGEMYEGVNRNYFVVMEKEAILIQENEYLRRQFESAGRGERGGDLNNSSFHDRQNSIIEFHRVNFQNKELNNIIHQLQAKLKERDNTTIHLEENVRALALEVEEKYKTIYELENEVKQVKGKLRDRSRNNISKMSDSGAKSNSRLN